MIGSWRGGWVVLAGLLAACEAPSDSGSVLDLDEPPPPRESPRPGLAQALERALGTVASDARVEVQLDARPGQSLGTIDEAELDALDAHVVARSRPVMTVTAPAGAVPALAALDEVGWVRLPARPIADLGPVTSEGIEATGAGRLHCLGVDGAGVEVAIVDHFGDYGQARLAGELATVVEPPVPSDDPHGTACAEIVSDMAPGVSLHLVHSDGLADLLAFVESLDQQHIDVMSHSVSYFGYGFGDGEGVLCDAARQAADAGTVWVNSAGNHGSWQVYRASFEDDDGDGWHEFEGGIEVSDLWIGGFGQGSGVTVRLDWNAYPTTDVDFDLYLRRWDGAAWVVVAESTNVQAGAEPPTEALTWTTDGAPVGVSVARRGGSTDPIDLRIIADGGLSYARQAGSIGDPASCPDVLAVGATREETRAETYSARGPTFDGRTKPDLIAPAMVHTSGGWFSGTSAAAPHVTGAIALTMQARAVTAPEAAAILLDEAAEARHPIPNDETGWGRLALDAEVAGWQCVLGQTQDCATPCGTTGTQACGAACGWSECVPPVEICNALDDDCDGAADEDFLCVGGTTRACATSCGTAGTQSCETGCNFGACVAAEQCNGIDDDCDGTVDEDGGCPERVTYGGCSVAAQTRDAPAGDSAAVWAVGAALVASLARRRRRSP